MVFKIIAFVLFLIVVFNLFRGLYYLVKENGQSKKTVRSLTYRVTFSVALIIFLLFSAAMGWIKPHSLNPEGTKADTREITD